MNNHEFSPNTITHEFFDRIFGPNARNQKVWIVMSRVTDCVPNDSTANTHEIFGRRKIYNLFFSCLRVNNYEFQPKTIIYEFLHRMFKIKKYG